MTITELSLLINAVSNTIAAFAQWLAVTRRLK